MSDTKKTAEKAEEISRKIWLAGLGAYGQSLDNLNRGYEKMNDQAREYFEELVARGEKLEKGARSNFKSTTGKIREQAEKNKALLNKQFADLKEKVSDHIAIPSLDKDELLEELQAHVAKLTETLNKILPAKEKKAPVKKAPAKKAAAKKTTTRRAGTRKPAAKKPSPGKTSAAKSNG